MKKVWTIFLFLTINGGFAFGQFLPITPKSSGLTLIGKIKVPIVIVDSLKTDYGSCIIQADNLKIIKILEDSVDLARYGEQGKGGVILATLQKKVNLLRLPEVLRYFKISKEKQQLKVLVDQAMVNPQLFLADVNMIERIEVVQQSLFAPVLYSFNKNEEYLNIVTKKE